MIGLCAKRAVVASETIHSGEDFALPCFGQTRREQAIRFGLWAGDQALRKAGTVGADGGVRTGVSIITGCSCGECVEAALTGLGVARFGLAFGTAGAGIGAGGDANATDAGVIQGTQIVVGAESAVLCGDSYTAHAVDARAD